MLNSRSTPIDEQLRPYCLVFAPDVIEHFTPEPPFGHDAPPAKVNTELARAR